jgi:hypothetical protein
MQSYNQYYNDREAHIKAFEKEFRETQAEIHDLIVVKPRIDLGT